MYLISILNGSLLGVASWREMVEEAIGDDAKLQAELLLMLINVNDPQEGLYWAKKHEIPRERWPWAITYAEERNKQSNVLLVSRFLSGMYSQHRSLQG